MLNFLFGKTFWSTVIRAALLLPVLSLVTLPLAFVFGSPDDIEILESYGILQWTASVVLSLTFGAWFGWGFAYWRFDRRPIRRGWFAVFPLVTGLYFGPLMFWMLIESSPPELEITTSDAVAAYIFGAVTMPFMALLTALFWRYALNLTALKRDKH